MSQRWNSGRGVRESRVQFDWDKGRLRQLPREQRGRPWLDDKIQPFYRIPNGEFKKKSVERTDGKDEGLYCCSDFCVKPGKSPDCYLLMIRFSVVVGS